VYVYSLLLAAAAGSAPSCRGGARGGPGAGASADVGAGGGRVGAGAGGCVRPAAISTIVVRVDAARCSAVGGAAVDGGGGAAAGGGGGAADVEAVGRALLVLV